MEALVCGVSSQEPHAVIIASMRAISANLRVNCPHSASTCLGAKAGCAMGTKLVRVALPWGQTGRVLICTAVFARQQRASDDGDGRKVWKRHPSSLATHTLAQAQQGRAVCTRIAQSCRLLRRPSRRESPLPAVAPPCTVCAPLLRFAAAPPPRHVGPPSPRCCGHCQSALAAYPQPGRERCTVARRQLAHHLAPSRAATSATTPRTWYDRTRCVAPLGM